MRRRAACVLSSGGLDSAVLLRDALRTYRRVQPLYVRAGLRWEPAEERALRAFVRALRRVPTVRGGGFADRDRRRLADPVALAVPMADLYGVHWSTTGRRVPGYFAGDPSVYLPGRNIALLSKAATFCALRGFQVVITGILSANPFPDGTPRFLRAMERALSAGLGRPIRIRAPFRRLTKRQVIRRGRDLPLGRTLSCCRPVRGGHCGCCVKCGERARAFRDAGVPDPTRYAGGPGAEAPAAGRGAGRPGRKRSRTTRVAPKNTTSSR
jgi:7-cyano-7-deazaguanine synthase